MKKIWTMMALMIAVSMLAAGCSKAEPAADTTEGTETATVSVDETEAASDESAAEDETKEEIPPVNYSEGLDDDGNLIAEMNVEGITLPEYNNPAVTKEKVFATEDTIQEALDTLLSNYATEKQVTDREVKDGDIVNIDYVGTIDGVAFDGGDSQEQGYDLTIGSGSFIDTFEQQLIGAKPGDVVTVKVTFPEDYGKDELNGKAAEFKTTIHYIVEEEYPELTDAFVEENMKESYGFTTVDDLMADIRNYYDVEAVWAWLDEETKFANEPDAMVDALLENYMNSVRANLQEYDITMEDYLAYLGMETVDDMKNEQRESAAQLAKRYAICQAIGDAEGIVVDEAAMNEYFDGGDIDSAVETYGNGYVKMNVRMHYVAQKILELAKA